MSINKKRKEKKKKKKNNNQKLKEKKMKKILNNDLAILPSHDINRVLIRFIKLLIVKDGTNRGQRRGVTNKSVLWNDILHYFRE